MEAGLVASPPQATAAAAVAGSYTARLCVQCARFCLLLQHLW
jgi:hypothetical protein